MHTTGQPYRKHKGIEGDFDAIIVGSGMGGMTAAVMLAKQGMRVLVLEQNSVVGGLTQSYSRGGYRWNTGLHYIGDVADPKRVTHRLFKYLTDGGIQWAPLPEIYNKMVIADRVYEVPAGRVAFAEALKTWFPDDADAIDTYMDLVVHVNRTSNAFFAQKALPEKVASQFPKDAFAPFFEHANERTIDALQALTSNQELIAVLCANWGDYSSPPHRSSFAMHCMLNKHYMDGGSYPVGGAAVLADNMMPIVESAGGAVYHSAEVAAIITEDGRAAGVQLTSGETVRAKTIVSNAGVQNTFGRLLSAEDRQAFELEAKLDEVDDTYAVVGINLGLSASAQSLGIDGANVWAHPSNDFEANLARHKEEFDAPFPWTFTTFPSAKDPSWDETHPNKATIEMYAYTNFEHFKCWAGTPWMKRGADYEQLKDTIKARLLTELERFVPGVTQAIDIAEVSTPLTYETFTKRQFGGFMGVESTPEKFSKTWLRAPSPIKGLYLSGQDVTADGIIGALMGGLICASSVTGKDLLSEVIAATE